MGLRLRAFAVVVTVITLVLAGCASNGQPTTTPAEEVAVDSGIQAIADVALVELFFLEYALAWEEDLLEGAIRFNVEHSHPDLEYSEDLWRCDVPQHISPPVLFVDGSVTPADGWVFPESPRRATPLDGTVPRGRLYEVDINPLEVVNGSLEISSETVTIHVAVIDAEPGSPEVYWFARPFCV